MSAGPYDLVVRTNEYLARPFQWSDDDGTPINLTGYTGKLEVRAAAGAAVQLSLTTGNGGIVISALTGEVTLNASVATLAAISPGNYFYDLILFDSDGKPTALLAGRCIVEAGITAVS